MDEKRIVGEGSLPVPDSSSSVTSSDDDAVCANGETASTQGDSLTSEGLWQDMYDRLLQHGLSLSVLIDCLQLREVSETLLQLRIITQYKLVELVEIAERSKDYVNANRLLLDMIVQRKPTHKKLFIELIKEKQVHIWYFSQKHWCGPKPLSTTSRSEWQFVRTSVPKVWLRQVNLDDMLLTLRSEQDLSHVQYLELVTLGKNLPRCDVEERLVCIFQWKPAASQDGFCSVLQALARQEKQRTGGRFEGGIQRGFAQRRLHVVPVLYGATAQELAEQQHYPPKVVDGRGVQPRQRYLSTKVSESLWTLLYDVLVSSGLSLTVVVDCIDTLSIAELLYRHGVLRRIEFECIRRVKEPLDAYSRRWLVNVMTTKPLHCQQMFAQILLMQQPYIVELSTWFWSGPEPFSTSCRLYWSLKDGFVHKESLTHLAVPSFLQILQSRLLLTPLECKELMTLTERLPSSDVSKRLTCVMMMKKAKEQADFLSLLQDATCRLKVSNKKGRYEKDVMVAKKGTTRKGAGRRKPRQRAKAKSAQNEVLPNHGLKVARKRYCDQDSVKTVLSQEADREQVGLSGKVQCPAGAQTDVAMVMDVLARPEGRAKHSVSTCPGQVAQNEVLPINEGQRAQPISEEGLTIGSAQRADVRKADPFSSEVRGKNSCDVKAWTVIFDSLSLASFPPAAVIDNMPTQLIADLLMDNDLLQSKAYLSVRRAIDVWPAEANRFLIDHISQQDLLVRQKFVEWLMKYSQELASTCESGGNLEKSQLHREGHFSELQRSLNQADMSAILEAAQRSGTFSRLELCELSTLMQRVSASEMKMRLIAVVGQMPDELMQASIAAFRDIGESDSVQLTGVEASTASLHSVLPASSTSAGSEHNVAFPALSKDSGLTLSVSADEEQAMTLEHTYCSENGNLVCAPTDSVTSAVVPDFTSSPTKLKPALLLHPQDDEMPASSSKLDRQLSNDGQIEKACSPLDVQCSSLVYPKSSLSEVNSSTEPNSPVTKQSSSTFLERKEMSSTTHQDSMVSPTLSEEKTVASESAIQDQPSAAVLQVDSFSASAGLHYVLPARDLQAETSSPTDQKHITTSAESHCVKVSLSAAQQVSQEAAALDAGVADLSGPMAGLNPQTAAPTSPIAGMAAPTAPDKLSYLKRCLEKNTTLETVVQFMRFSALSLALQEANVLSSKEASKLDALSKQQPRCRVNEELLRLVSWRPEKEQDVFIDVLLRKQSELHRNAGDLRLRRGQKKFRESFLLDDPQPPTHALMEVSKGIHDHWAAVRLAIALDIGDDRVNRVRAAKFEDDMVFTQVLETWRAVHGRDATKQVLHSALIKIGRTDLADRLNRALRTSPDVREDEHDKALLLDFTEQTRLWYKSLIDAQSRDCAPFCGKRDQVNVMLSLLTFLQASQLMDEQQRVPLQRVLADEVPYPARRAKVGQLLKTAERETVRALVLGPSGSGKTALCDRVVSDWVHERAPGQFAVVVHLLGQDRTRLRSTRMTDLLRLDQYGLKQSEQERLLRYLKTCSHRVLFLIDGADEFDWDGVFDQKKRSSSSRTDSGETPVLSDVVYKRIFPNASLVITSRPSLHLDSLLSICSKHFYLQGFADQQLQEFFEQRLPAELVSSFMANLGEAALQHMKLQIKAAPFLASMATELFAQHRSIPNTICGLLQEGFLEVCRRYENRQSTAVSATEGRRSIDHAVTELQRLALSSLMEKSFTFEKSSIDGATFQVARGLGLMVEVQQIAIKAKPIYSFSHMMWLEFLAAQGLALAQGKDFNDRLHGCIKDLGVTEVTWSFWQFLSTSVPPHQLPEVIYQLLNKDAEQNRIGGSQPFKCFLTRCVAELANYHKHQKREFIQMALEMIWEEGRLYVMNYNLSPAEAQAVGMALNVSPGFKGLCIHGSWLQDKHYEMLAQGLANLQRLDLRQVGIMSEHALCQLTNAASSCQQICISDSTVREVAFVAFMKALAKSNVKHLSLNNCGLTSSILRNMMSTLKSIGLQCHLERLSVLYTKLHQSSAALKLLVEVLPDLKVLELNSCNMLDNDVCALLIALQSNNKMAELSVTQNQLTESTLQSLGKLLCARHESSTESPAASRQTLRIHVGGNEGLVLAKLNQLVQQYRHADVVLLHDSCMFSKEGYKELDFVGDLKNLWYDGHVVFDHNAGKSATSKIGKVLERNRSVSTIAIPMSHVCDEGASHMANVLLDNTTLEGISLRENRISMAGWQALYAGVRENKTLTTLDISKNPLFQENEPPQPYRTLEDNFQPSLQVLCLSQTSMDDESLEHWGKPILMTLQLTTLDLSHNSISDRGFRYMLRFLKRPEFSLSTLSLSNNCITDSGVTEMSKKLQAILREKPGHPLQRIFLGGNGITHAFFATCDCSILFSGSFSLTGRWLKTVVDTYTRRSSIGHHRAVSRKSSVLPVRSSIEMMRLLGSDCRDDESCECWLQRCLSDNTNRQPTAEFYLNLTDLLIFSKSKIGYKDQLELCCRVTALIDVLLRRGELVEQFKERRLHIEIGLDAVANMFPLVDVAKEIEDLKGEFLPRRLPEVAKELTEQAERILFPKSKRRN